MKAIDTFPRETIILGIALLGNVTAHNPSLAWMKIREAFAKTSV